MLKECHLFFEWLLMQKNLHLIIKTIRTLTPKEGFKILRDRKGFTIKCNNVKKRISFPSEKGL